MPTYIDWAILEWTPLIDVVLQFEYATIALATVNSVAGTAICATGE
jgi:hypothetical protein